MATRPHDIPDLFLAPVVLAIDAKIEELARLDARQLAYEVALESDIRYVIVTIQVLGAGVLVDSCPLGL